MNSFSTQISLPATFPNFNSQWYPGHTWVSSFDDQILRACTHPHFPGLVFVSPSSQSQEPSCHDPKIPDDAVTTNWSSVQKVCLVRVQPCTTRHNDLLRRTSIRVLDLTHASMTCTNSCTTVLHSASAHQEKERENMTLSPCMEKQ